MLTQERANAITAYLTSDVAKAEELLNMDVVDALAKMNADGYDFTIEELKAYVAELKNVKTGELDAEDLDKVAGGFGITAALLCVGGGIILGVAVNANW